MTKLEKLTVKSNVLTDSQKKKVLSGSLTDPESDHCGAGCKSRCGDKTGSKGAQYEALN